MIEKIELNPYLLTFINHKMSVHHVNVFTEQLRHKTCLALYLVMLIVVYSTKHSCNVLHMFQYNTGC